MTFPVLLDVSPPRGGKRYDGGFYLASKTNICFKFSLKNALLICHLFQEVGFVGQYSESNRITI